MYQQQSTDQVITVDRLALSIGNTRILNDISFDVSDGSFIGILGPNGAGKSSLLRCLYRYFKPSQGCVNFKQKNIWQMDGQEYAQRVAVVLQHTPQHFQLSTKDVVGLGLVPHKALFSFDRRQDKHLVFEALEQVGLLNKQNMDFESLSGGEKQRAMIARAIVQRPELLIMDEPTSHLDVKYQIQIMELAKSLGITVIASFHDLNLASALCDKLLLLHKGNLVASGSPGQVITEQQLSEVFDVCAHVGKHPQHAVPHITYYYGYQQGKDHEA